MSGISSHSHSDINLFDGKGANATEDPFAGSLFDTGEKGPSEESLFDEPPITLIQAEEPPPSELGAVPGQHIRPGGTDVLGSIGFPEMRP